MSWTNRAADNPASFKEAVTIVLAAGGIMAFFLVVLAGVIRLA